MSPFKHCRKLAGKTVEQAAEELAVSVRQLHRYEADEIIPPPDIVMKMAEIYHAPTLIRWYRANIDPVGKKLEPPILNRINRSHFARLSILAKELREGYEAAMRMAQISVNKNSDADFTEAEKEEFFQQYTQAITDSKQAVCEAEEACMELFGVRMGLEAMERHWSKMISHGYLVVEGIAAGNKIPLAVAERRASYSL